ncbi:MAG: NmrA/HSCARG family protein [Candidatus Lokiarchaeota archaeon]
MKIFTYVRPLFVLVTGATGKQGGAVVRALLDFGHRVRGLTRSPNSEKAKLLEDEGVEIVKGNFNDPDSVREAMRDVDAVFLMGTSMEGGPKAEIKQGITVADIAKDLDLKHLVYSSVASANKSTGVPHFDSKFEIEKHIRDIRIPHTIIRPVSFMENFIATWNLKKLKDGIIERPLSPDRISQLIAVRDIGRFVLHVLENREQFLGKAIDIASDEVSGKEIGERFTRVLGHPVRYHQQDTEDLKAMGEAFFKMYQWVKDVGYDVDIKKLHSKYPKIGW